jgi:hypothetical protein
MIAIHLSRLRTLFYSSREAESAPEAESRDSGSGDQDFDQELSDCKKTCNEDNNLGSQGNLNFELSK